MIMTAGKRARLDAHAAKMRGRAVEAEREESRKFGRRPQRKRSEVDYYHGVYAPNFAREMLSLTLAAESGKRRTQPHPGD
jgi:hypothetical protein